MRFLSLLLALITTPALAWTNGTNGQCPAPGYSTHDWIADHARAMLPAEERAWLDPHRNMLLLGTEAPDNDDIPASCGAPHSGYDDRRRGHSVEWLADGSNFAPHPSGGLRDRAARRAREEYAKAADAFEDGNAAAAAFFLGAMAHYIGDLAQYGHTYPDEVVHSAYESWAARRTDSFDDEQVFESYLQTSNLTRRKPYTAAKRVSRAVLRGQGDILPATEMDQKYAAQERDQAFIDSTGGSAEPGGE